MLLSKKWNTVGHPHGVPVVRASRTWLVAAVVIDTVNVAAIWVVVTAEVDHILIAPLPDPLPLELVVVGPLSLEQLLQILYVSSESVDVNLGRYLILMVHP